MSRLEPYALSDPANTYAIAAMYNEPDLPTRALRNFGKNLSTTTRTPTGPYRANYHPMTAMDRQSTISFSSIKPKLLRSIPAYHLAKLGVLIEKVMILQEGTWEEMADSY
jgi:hypothetical protein